MLIDLSVNMPTICKFHMWLLVIIVEKKIIVNISMY